MIRTFHQGRCFVVNSKALLINADFSFENYIYSFEVERNVVYGL